MTRHLLRVDDLTAAELDAVLERAAGLKAAPRAEVAGTLPDHTLTMVFEKPSTRTRVSFETGMTDLGGHAVFLGPDDVGLGEREPLRDTARVLSGYGDAVMARLFDHGDMEELAEHATVPLINGLTDDAHPCQTLADLLTIEEAFGGFEDVQAAWIGDGNNVAQSFAVGCALAGLDLTVATPEGYGLDDEVLERAAELGGTVETTTDPEEAAAGADVAYTDVWVSMGESGKDLSAFEGFRLDAELLDSDTRVMHCLPANREQEIANDVLESERSLAWQQAENRLHAQKGLLAFLLA